VVSEFKSVFFWRITDLFVRGIMMLLMVMVMINMVMTMIFLIVMMMMMQWS